MGSLAFQINYLTQGGQFLYHLYIINFLKKINAVDAYGNPIGGYKQIQKGDTKKDNDDFLMKDIFVLLQEELLKNKP